jgi:hypothetical protein
MIFDFFVGGAADVSINIGWQIGPVLRTVTAKTTPRREDLRNQVLKSLRNLCALA